MDLKLNLTVTEGRTLKAYLDHYLPRHSAHFMEYSQYTRVIMPPDNAKAFIALSQVRHETLLTKIQKALSPKLDNCDD